MFLLWTFLKQLGPPKATFATCDVFAHYSHPSLSTIQYEWLFEVPTLGFQAQEKLHRGP